jgi:uncharacterized protein YodC (DUF2158 family)
MDAKFRKGDIVQLKSGGPTMTIKQMPDGLGDEYICQWFGGKKLEQGYFPPESLKKATEDAK